MAAATQKSVFLRGLRDGSPFLLVAVPFAALFGVSAMEAGLSLGQAMGFSVLVIAGASQFAALQMIVDNAGIALTLLAALAVNLRMAMYSASLVPYLGAAPMWKRAVAAYLMFDQSYVASLARYEADPGMSLASRASYFFGVATAIAPAWVISTWAGAVLGARIPPEAALDFALPITFIAMLGPMLRTLAHVAAAAVSVVVALALAGLPSGAGLLIAAGCAMVAGVLVEERLT
ncbi:branched-chain amino acid ABC transporter permease [Salipiger sp. IMCC34102]|uniref:AzlC family ABC transporter permease n=1 Tax=Salipiger sp. IMCC34102 TaxID=2510647 RepID=UPI00101BC416|nr:AzlC family ABC transporter permease [Salipiger sp. IMCC34102]RYH01636.1 branched-chain amino acid ABC transporter permease [Salipiger sp. IMCC34102]